MNISNRYIKPMITVLLMPVICCLAQAAWAATPQIRSGVEHTIQLRSDGTLWTTGANSSGQLGDGTTINRMAPVQVGLFSNATNWVAVAAGDDHTLALKADGSLWAWGNNAKGQLGDGTSANKSAMRSLWRMAWPSAARVVMKNVRLSAFIDSAGDGLDGFDIHRG